MKDSDVVLGEILNDIHSTPLSELKRQLLNGTTREISKIYEFVEDLNSETNQTWQ